MEEFVVRCNVCYVTHLNVTQKHYFDHLLGNLRGFPLEANKAFTFGAGVSYRGELYSAYTPGIEIDIPRKVGPQQNERNNASRGILLSSIGIAGKTARDLIHSAILCMRVYRCSSLSPRPPNKEY